MPYLLLFFEKWQNFKLLSAANYRWRFNGYIPASIQSLTTICTPAKRRFAGGPKVARFYILIWLYVDIFKPSINFSLTVPRRCFFFGSFVFLIYVSCLSLLCCLVCSLQPCGHLLGKGLTSWLSFCYVFL